MTNKTKLLETQLNDFDAEVRADALTSLVALTDQGQVITKPTADVANMHCHTFFSYNGYGYSPSALAWLAKKQGYKLMGIVDFDVLDAVDEFLDACALVGVRGSAGMETRVFIPEFATREINSPGEPGIFYHMGIGFTSSHVPDDQPEAQAILTSMRSRAEQRNRGLIDRVNAYLAPVALDYDRDVLPLTPAGNATERHICEAYVKVTAKTVADPVQFWADKLATSTAEIASIIDNAPKIENLVRSQADETRRRGLRPARPRYVPQRRRGQHRDHSVWRAAVRHVARRHIGG